MLESVKIIEKYEQNKKFKKLNYNRNEEDHLNLEQYGLNDEIMQKFMSQFKLDDIYELQTYEIHQLLDKEKYQAEQQQSKYVQSYQFAQGKLYQIFNDKQIDQKEEPTRNKIHMTIEAIKEFNILSKKVSGFYSTNVIGNNGQAHLLNGAQVLRESA